MTIASAHLIMKLQKQWFVTGKEDMPMKKKLLKIAALIGLAAMMTVGLAGCKKTECEWCGEKAYCKPMYLNMLGEYNMCKECRRGSQLRA